MSETGVTLYYYLDYPSGKTATLELAAISSVSLTATEKFRLVVTGTGTASDISVGEDAVLSVKEEGTAAGITVLAKSSSGDVMDGYLYVGDGGLAEEVNVYGDVEIDTLGAVSGATVHSGGVVSLFSRGILNETSVENGGRVYSYSSYLSNITLKSGSLAAVYGGSLDTVVVKNGASLLLNSSAVLQNATLESGGSLSLSTGSMLAGDFHVAAGSSISAQEGTYVEFVLSAPSAVPFIEDYAGVSGSPYYIAAVSEAQEAGSYALIGNAASFASPLYVGCGDYAMMTLSLGGTGTYHNSVYALSLNEGKLAVNVSAYQTAATADALAWTDINGAESYVLELSNGETGLALEVGTHGVDLLGIANGDYAWRVRNAAEADNWQTGEAFSQTAEPEGPQKLEAVPNDATDLFFAKKDGIWDSGFIAKHVGNKGGWAGTGETVELAGKARITDIFAGSEDASILMLDAFGENAQPTTRAVVREASGVALFLDDIYSAAAGTAEQARLSNIDTILATDGADIIDLTSRRFAFDGGVTVHGNGGDDVIWANSGENTLFGGDGDDRIVGGSGDDVIIGGAGDDVLHGGGGNDIFCFGENWGNDTVSQLPDGAVTLWFSQSNDILQLAFTADSGDTLISAPTGDTILAVGMSVSLDDCRFGAAGYETEYNTLASSGVFA